ncbi:MAG: DHA2 family efflux MFS transporter permease subunit [Candidatus Eremiobacteraeota bacterium]|nr:DHA2 family efflux MFS transporter permease subunit [Candidatus Eremiobacteraeota bacterium]
MQDQPYEKRVTGNRYMIAAAVMISALTAILDSTIVNVSVPNIQAAFGADIDQITWVLTGYLISNVIVIPMTGWLSNLIGLKRYYMFSQLAFVGASMLCGLSWNLPSLIFFRILQGIGGGALLPVSFSIMLEAFPPEQTALATAIFGSGSILGPIIGPTLGGWLTDNLTWRWIFYVNVPIVALGLFMTSVAIHTPKREITKRLPIDVYGLAAATVWLASFQVVLQNGQREGWFDSGYIVVLSFVSTAALLAFLWVELRTAHPFINLRIFTDYNFLIGNIMGVVVASTLFGSVFLLPVFCAQILHYTALQIGLSLLPAALASLPCFAIVGRLTGMIDPRLLCAIGFVGLATSCWFNSFINADLSFSSLVWFNTTRSVALPFIFVPLTAIGIQNLPQRQKPEASALYNLTRTLGGSLAIAALGSLVVQREVFHSERFGEAVTAFSSSVNSRLTALQSVFQARAGSDPTLGHDQAIQALHAIIAQQAAIASFDDCFRILAFISAGAIVLVFLARPKALAR